MKYRRLDLTYQSLRSLHMAHDTAKTMNHYYIGTEHLLIGLRQMYTGIASQILAKYAIETDEIQVVIQAIICDTQEKEGIPDKLQHSPQLMEIITTANTDAHMSGSRRIGTEHLLLAILKEKNCAGYKVLEMILDQKVEEMYMDLIKTLGFEDYDSDINEQDFAEEINSFTTDLSIMAKEGKIDPVIGREKEIKRLMEILIRRNKNNPCIIGEPGIGKTAIAEGLALEIHEGNVPSVLADKKILSLDLSAMMAGTKYRGEFEQRLKMLMDQVKLNPDIIIFIDEIHTIIGTGKGEGGLDLANMLKPALSKGEFQVIGATTITEYRKHIEKDTALERRLQPIFIEEPTQEECYEILKGLRTRYELYHKVKLSDEVLVQAIELSKRYITDRFLPDKAIDVLDESCAKVNLIGYKSKHELLNLEKERERLIKNLDYNLAIEPIEVCMDLNKKLSVVEDKIEEIHKQNKRKKEKKVLPVELSHIREVIAQWSKIPIDKLEESERTKLKRLENTLKKSVIGQEEAIKSVSKAIKRGRVGLKDPSRPIGSFLFLGPTGVGKTQLTKTLAEVMYGGRESFVRVDMSEYMEKASVSKMIGSPPGYVGYEEVSQLADKVRSNPYSVVLFDEIEKAHPDVFNIMLQILDDGQLTDSKGRKIDFKNTVIIMTSNVGAKSIVEPKELGFVTQENKEFQYEKMKSLVMGEVKQQFKPEFINRIDEIIVFHKLEKEHLKQIVNLLVSKFIVRVEEQLTIHLKVKPAVKNLILDKGLDIKYGARPLKRALQNYLEDPLAEALLQGEVKENCEVMATVLKGQVLFSVVEK